MRLSLCLLSSLLLLVASPLWAEQPAESNDAFLVAVEQVLELGPLPISAGFLEDSDKTDALQRALVEQLARGAMPRVGAAVPVFGQSLSWRHRSPPTAGNADAEGLWLWSWQLETDRFVQGSLRIEGLENAQLFNGAMPVPAEDDRAHELALRNGTHTLWLLHRGPKDEQAPAITWHGKSAVDRVQAHTRPERRVSPQRLTNAETVTSMAISPDGRFLALAFDGRSDAADLDLRRMEIRDLEQSRIVRQWTGARPKALAWSPDGRFLALHEENNVWLHAWPGGEARLLLANHENLGSFRWHPDSGSIIFSWTEPFKAEDVKARRMRALEDRWATFRDNSQLYQVDIASGMIRPLTAGERSVNLLDIHPDGDRLLASERLIDYAEPPHSLFRLLEISLEDLQQREIGRYRVLTDARFAAEGYWLLSGPGLPIGDGVAFEADLVPNERDTQLYRLSADGRTARSVSRELAPSLNGIHRLPGGDLLLPATDRDYKSLLFFDAGLERFSTLETGVEVTESFVASEGRRPVVALRGTDADRPQRVHLVDVRRNRNRTLIDSQPAEYPDVRLGRVVPWTFTNADGDEIDGRYYLPPDFDPQQKYPLIVYYYGGTNPVDRQFTGRYPFNLWAAQGYVIYVLQPRGATGYGQEFSARHVNAWGKYTADDIIEGTRKFVAAHDFVDGERIGNIGASYGGFMTMHLATLTDLYAASISHAGISALTGYWGEGWWGYGYSGLASRDSFPWNNPELYVGQSPVYSADRITTPLLLLTGDSDTNVPPGESHNMYTALKLLGREVELIEIPEQDHWILDREKRYVWWDTMLAWFDYWLKDQPEWWHHLYPETRE
jgi:acylaminoacyl-peptidase